MAFIPQLQHPLFLCSLKMTPEGGLEIIVRHSCNNDPPSSPIGRTAWDVLSYPAEVKPSASYSIIFDSFIAYTVGHEHFVKPDESAVGDGMQFARFQQSRYLSQIEESCYGADVQSGMRFHYGIYCLNLLMDVVTSEAPRIAYIGETAL